MEAENLEFQKNTLYIINSSSNNNNKHYIINNMWLISTTTILMVLKKTMSFETRIKVHLSGNYRSYNLRSHKSPVFLESILCKK